MKKINILLAASLMASMMAGCSDDTYGLEGEGNVKISTKVSSDVNVISRADGEAELLAACNIWISKSSGGLVRKYTGATLPTDIPLLSGEYIAEAWTGDSVPASWDARFYKGKETFTVTPGNTTSLSLRCTVANSLVSVAYTDDIRYLLKDVTLTVGHTRGNLTFEGYDDARKASFMMPNGVDELTYSLKGKKLDGTTFERTGSIPAVQPKTEYALTVKCSPNDSEIGGSFVTIEIDASEILVEDEIELTTAPEITGYGFDITKPVMGVPGTLDRKSVWIRSVAPLEELVVKNATIMSLIGYPAVEEFDYLYAEEEVKAAIAAGGITIRQEVDATSGLPRVKISFEASLLNQLPEGTYPIEITATDTANRTGSATLTIEVANVPVAVGAVEEGSLTYTSAVVTGTILKDDATGVKFEYRDKEEAGAWTSVPAVAVSAPAPASRAAVTIQVRGEITGLTQGHTYEYRLVTDSFNAGPVMEFTLPSVQLPNCGFEEWQTGCPALAYAAGGSMFWDSGNHGSSTMGKNVTERDSQVKHSGNYSAKLASQFVGIGTIGKFAAGNIFIGEYLGTEGTDGILGFGRPFNQCPRALRVWVKYKPSIINYEGGKKITTSEMDQGIIYVALLDETIPDPSYPNYPVIIKTKTSQLFDKNGANVIAYGEKLVDETSGEEMVQIEVPLDYKSSKTPSYILCTMAASKGGDYFRGGGSSTMWVDDVELIY